MALAVAIVGAVTFNTNAGVKTVAATPTLGDQIIVIVGATGVASGLGVTDNNTDGHGTYTQIVSSVKSTSADQLAAFVRADPIRQAVATTWTTSGDGASSGGGLVVLAVTGATITGANFIRQTGKQDNGAAAGTPATLMSVGAILTGNAVIATVWNTTNIALNLTKPAGFAAVNDVSTNYNTPATGWQVIHANTGVTASTVTWGSTSATAFSALTFEMRVDAGDGKVGDAEDLTKTRQNAMKRGAFFCLGEKWSRRGGLLVPSADRPYVLA